MSIYILFTDTWRIKILLEILLMRTINDLFPDIIAVVIHLQDALCEHRYDAKYDVNEDINTIYDCNY